MPWGVGCQAMPDFPLAAQRKAVALLIRAGVTHPEENLLGEATARGQIAQQSEADSTMNR